MMMMMEEVVEAFEIAFLLDAVVMINKQVVVVTFHGVWVDNMCGWTSLATYHDKVSENDRLSLSHVWICRSIHIMHYIPCVSHFCSRSIDVPNVHWENESMTLLSRIVG